MTYAFNLSQFANNVDFTGKAILTSGQAVTGVLPVANGGSGASGFTNPPGVTGQVLLGSGTSSFGTVAPGASGNYLTSNGSTWISQVPPSTGIGIAVFNASGTWTVPPGVTKAIVWVYGGGFTSPNQYYVGGYGGLAIAYITSGLGSSQYVTVGGIGGSSSFGSLVSATGASGRLPANWGTGTVSSGTTIFTGSCGRTPYYGYSNTTGIIEYLAPANYIGNPAGQSFGMAGVSAFSGQISAIAGGVIIQY